MSCEVTYEELAAYAAGDMDLHRHAEMDQHLAGCAECRRRVEALAKTDAALASLAPVQPSAWAVLEIRRALSEIIRPRRYPEIMTLAEAADFLRVRPDELGEVAESLPAFELAGQVRVRRARLIEWIEQRERDYSRQRNESWVARSRVVGTGRGVA